MRRRVVAVLSKARPVDMVEERDPDTGELTGRLAAWVLGLTDGDLSHTVLTAGRFVRDDWAVRPDRTARQVGICSTAWGVHRTAEGCYRAHPQTCDSATCPACAPLRAARREAKVVPLASAAAAAGCPLVHCSITHRHKPSLGNPVVLTRRERDSDLFRGHTVDTIGASVPGELLLEGFERLDAAFRALRNRKGDRFRNWFRWNVWGYIAASDVTGRVWEGGRFRLRWHPHKHCLMALRPGVDPHVFFAELVERWEELTAEFNDGHGATIRGQDMRILAADDPAELEAAIAEVVKYPVKLGDLTDAQVLEFLAARKGAHSYTPGGAWHGNSGLAKLVRRVRAAVSADLFDPNLERALEDLGEPERIYVDELVKARDEQEEREAAVVALWRTWAPGTEEGHVTDGEGGYRAPTTHDGRPTGENGAPRDLVEGPGGHWWRPLRVADLVAVVDGTLADGGEGWRWGDHWEGGPRSTVALGVGHPGREGFEVTPTAVGDVLAELGAVPDLACLREELTRGDLCP